MSLCCHAVVDYQYGTWFSCRACGRWFEQTRQSLLAGHTFVTVEAVLMSFNVYPARAHAAHMGQARQHDQEQVPLL